MAMILLALLSLVCGSAASHADDCEIPGEQPVSVRLDAPSTELDRKLARAAITARAKADRPTQADATRTLGRTEVDITFDLNTRTATKPDGHGGFCAAIFTADLVVHWKTRELVAAELERGSCMYNVVSRHGELHVAVARRFQAETEARFRNAIMAAIRQPITAPTAEQGSRTVRHDLWKVVSDTLDGLIVEMNSEEATLDTPEELLEGRKVCGDAAYEASFTD